MAKEFKVHNINVPFGALIKVGQNPHFMGNAVSVQVMIDDRWFEVMLDEHARRRLVDVLQSYEKEN